MTHNCFNPSKFLFSKILSQLIDHSYRMLKTRNLIRTNVTE